MRAALLGTCTLLLSFAAAAEPVRVIDGDGLEISGTVYHLHGIDAPELDQTCEREGVTYACGEVAAEALRAFVGDDPVSCDPVNRDRYGRTIARCSVDGVDLGSMMVNAGWALDWPRYSRGAYQVEQDAAQAAGRGLWGGSFVIPWEWRAREF